jgi:hypothetical protein
MPQFRRRASPPIPTAGDQHIAAMTSPGPESSGNGEPPDLTPRMLAVLRMDLKDSENAVVKDENAFKQRMMAIRSATDNKEAYRSIVGGDGGEGDSIRLAFTNVRDALLCAIYLRHQAQQPIKAADGTSFSLKPRIVLHFGEFTVGWKGRIEGRAQILVTRLDKSVTPGEIFATEAFYNIVCGLEADRGYSFDYVGECDLDKNSGKYPCFMVGIADEDTSQQRSLDVLDLAMQLFRRGDQASQADAVEALGAIESVEASRQLTDIALNGNFARRVRHAALVKLQERGDDIDIDRIIGEFDAEGHDIETRALLLLALGASGREEIFETLSSVVSTQSWSSRIKEAALLAMRRQRGSLIADSVHAGLKCADIEVRIAACAAAATDGMSDDVQAKLYDIIKDLEAPVDLRATACEALASQKLTSGLRDRLSEVVLDRHF